MALDLASTLVKICGMAIRGRFVEQEKAPRCESGVSFSGAGIVLVHSRQWKLIWRKGCRCWNGVGMPWAYAPAELQVIGNISGAPSYGHLPINGILSGGRLTLERIKEALPRIRKLMKLPGLQMSHIDLKRTFIVGEK